MKVSVFGVGYVGLVQAAVFADAGHKVTCIDTDKEKIKQIEQGNIPIHERDLSDVVARNIKENRLRFSSSAELGVKTSEILFIAVGTPPNEDGSANIGHVLSVARTIGRCMDARKIIVNKSTVPVGTADKVESVIQSELDLRRISLPFDVVSNPEFLKEGVAVQDCTKPERIIIGSKNEYAVKKMRELYLPFNRNHDRIHVMDARSAELTKYAANCMLATKISFMNEMSLIAERLGADIELVRQGIGSDSRIGFDFIYPGCGYGGSCFPKDINALIYSAKESGSDSHILEAVDRVNRKQKNVIVEKIKKHFNKDINGKTFALWGLSFKPKTDDMREAPSRTILEALWDGGAIVQAYDPEAMHECQKIYGNRKDLVLAGTKEAALRGADALIVVTEWKQFWTPDFELIKNELAEPTIFDGRNMFDPGQLASNDITYYSIGRKTSG